MDIFAVKKDLEINCLALQPEEVVDAKWVSDAELRQMIDEDKVVKSVALRYERYSESLNRDC